MRVVRDVVGGATVLIQVVDDDLVDLTQSSEAYEPHSLEDKLAGAFLEARSVIRSIANDFATDFQTVPEASRPKQVDVEFSLALSMQGSMWILTSKGEGALKVKMSWELKRS